MIFGYMYFYQIINVILTKYMSVFGDDQCNIFHKIYHSLGSPNQ